MSTAQPSQPESELYVHRIDELRNEIRHAMAAIAGNQLHAFEDSLWRQEVLCTGLKHLAGTVKSAQPSSTLGVRVQASLRALHDLNRSYAELLRQAQASNSLLSTLCQGHRQQSTATHDPDAPRYSHEV